MNDKVEVDGVKLLELLSLTTSAELILERIQKMKLDDVVACDIDDFLHSCKCFRERDETEDK